ncbi:MAG: hypothetical protein ACJAX4_001944 [Clostridium sp.]
MFVLPARIRCSHSFGISGINIFVSFNSINNSSSLLHEI